MSNTTPASQQPNTTGNSEIHILRGKKILQFPTGLGQSLKDNHGNDVQYMMIRIVQDEKGGTLRNDATTGAAYEAAQTAQGIGIDTQPISTTPAHQVDPDFVTLNGNDTTPMIAKKGKVRLDKVIVLPMPNNYDVGTSVQYNNNFNPGLLTKLGDAVNSIGSGVTGELATILKNKAISGVLNKIKSGITNEQQLLAEEGVAINPKKEVMFENFGFRQFNFRYTLSPKNEAEAGIVHEIIETLRYYSLPEITPAKFLFILPAEFYIEFMIGNKINPNIPRIAASFLSRIQVNYAPGNVWASLPNGAPVAVDISMEFMENELIDRTRVYKATTSGVMLPTAGY